MENMVAKIEGLARAGKKSVTINSTGKDGAKYSAHLIIMATDPINGTMSIFKNGQAFLEKSFIDVLPVYEQAMENIEVLSGDRR